MGSDMSGLGGWTNSEEVEASSPETVRWKKCQEEWDEPRQPQGWDKLRHFYNAGLCFEYQLLPKYLLSSKKRCALTEILSRRPICNTASKQSCLLAADVGKKKKNQKRDKINTFSPSSCSTSHLNNLFAMCLTSVSRGPAAPWFPHHRHGSTAEGGGANAHCHHAVCRQWQPRPGHLMVQRLPAGQHHQQQRAH